MSAVYCGWATSRQLFPEKVMQQWAPQQQPRLLLLFLKTRLTTSSHGCIRHLPYTLPLGDLLQGHPINKMGTTKGGVKEWPLHRARTCYQGHRRVDGGTADSETSPRLHVNVRSALLVSTQFFHHLAWRQGFGKVEIECKVGLASRTGSKNLCSIPKAARNWQ